MTLSLSQKEEIESIVSEIEKHLTSSSLNLKCKGVFMGYDFHLSPAGPKLIEINTNAGGAFLNSHYFYQNQYDTLFFETFQNEWRLEKGDQPLQTIAIVDHEPHSQFLYSEFLLCQKIFLNHGVHAIIADPSELKWDQENLWYQNRKIDLVYNRLTDFYFQNKENISLKKAYESGETVITPNPLHHKIFANKENLEMLSRKITSGIPKSEKVTLEKASSLWDNRRHLFFKPICGYGSKGAYRGDKITHRVWQNILQSGDYIAQEYIPPSEQHHLKVDIRVYTYNAKCLLFVARLYTGQTTNFRTAGGGFAKIIFD